MHHNSDYSAASDWTWDSLDHSSAAALLAGYLPGAEDQNSLEPFGQGDFTLAFKLDNQVIRVARHLEAAAALRRESCVLAEIATMLPLPVPRPTYHSPRGCPPFTAHDKIVGEAFTSDDWANMPGEARAKVASDLASFLRDLHSLPVDGAQKCGVAQLHAAELARNLHKKAAEKILEFLAPVTRRRLDKTLARWSQAPHESQDPVLLHADIAPEHLLFYPPAGNLTGVIDFGDIAVGEPARDFIYIYEDFGPVILKEVLKRYAGKDAPTMIPAIRKWYLLETLLWAVGLNATRHHAELAHALSEIEREVSAIEW